MQNYIKNKLNIDVHQPNIVHSRKYLHILQCHAVFQMALKVPFVTSLTNQQQKHNNIISPSHVRLSARQSWEK